MITAEQRAAYARDGVVHLPGVLNARALREAQAAYDWSFAHPGPLASNVRQKTDATFRQDLYNPDCLSGYRAMLETSPVPELCAALWGTPDVWFMYEQVFLKEGGETRRTPWHQDSSYLAVDGEDLAVAWITFDACSAETSLEFVRGSHKGVLYNGSRFDVEDDTLPTHPNSSLPLLPDIEKARDAYDIVTWAVEPGDVVMFHPKTLHGGAATHPGARRRTLTLRFFGQRAHYDPREGGAGPRLSNFHDRMKAGAPFRDPRFLQLQPRAA